MYYIKDTKFQSTHSRGVRPSTISGIPIALSISIHALTRSATCCKNLQPILSHNFNPRTHEECDFLRLIECYFQFNFNPRTHEECDQRQSKACRPRYPISIHALTRSATSDNIGIVGTVIDFNPRTHEECDVALPRLVSFLLNFNPRTHEECDEGMDSMLTVCLDFNPRTHEECDAMRRCEKEATA